MKISILLFWKSLSIFSEKDFSIHFYVAIFHVLEIHQHSFKNFILSSKCKRFIQTWNETKFFVYSSKKQSFYLLKVRLSMKNCSISKVFWYLAGYFDLFQTSSRCCWGPIWPRPSTNNTSDKVVCNRITFTTFQKDFHFQLTTRRGVWAIRP